MFVPFNFRLGTFTALNATSQWVSVPVVLTVFPNRFAICIFILENRLVFSQEQSVDTTVKQQDTVLPVKEFEELLNSCCVE